MPPSADVQTQPTSVVDTLKQSIAHVESVLPSASKGRTSNSPADIAQAFCNSIQAAFDAKDVVGIERHFTEDGNWRDILVGLQVSLGSCWRPHPPADPFSRSPRLSTLT